MSEEELTFETAPRTKAISSICCSCGAQYDLENFKVGHKNSLEAIGIIDGHIEAAHKMEDAFTLSICLGGAESLVD